MPIIFQQRILDTTQLAVWQITETAAFFESRVPSPNHLAHPQVKLRHLAARYLLEELRAEFPYEAIQISPSGKPELPGSGLYFSLTHCGDYAAAILSERGPVGIDLEASGERIFRVKHKFLSDVEQEILQQAAGLGQLQEGEGAAHWLTIAWSVKESVYKWQGESGIDFIRDIILQQSSPEDAQFIVHFTPRKQDLRVNYRRIGGLALTWVCP